MLERVMRGFASAGWLGVLMLLAFAVPSATAAERVALVTANAFSVPALMCGMAEGRLSNITSMAPASMSVMAGPEPR